MNEYGLKELNYGPALALSCIPPWLLPDPEVNIDLLTEKSEHVTKHRFAQACLSYLNTSFYGYLKIFTDGSKYPKGPCGIVIYIPEFEKGYGYRVSDFLSVYSIQMTGIITALRWVVDTKPLRSVICTDSIYVLVL